MSPYEYSRMRQLVGLPENSLNEESAGKRIRANVEPAQARVAGGGSSVGDGAASGFKVRHWNVKRA